MKRKELAFDKLLKLQMLSATVFALIIFVIQLTLINYNIIITGIVTIIGVLFPTIFYKRKRYTDEY